MDLEIRGFQLKLIELINGTQLPLEVKRLVLEDVTRMVGEATEKAISEQAKAKQEQANGTEEKENEA